MAGYLTYANYNLAAGSTYPQATVEYWIARGESEIDAWLALADLTGSTSSETLESAAVLLTMVYQVQRMMMDGSRLNSISVGGLSMSDQPQANIKLLREEAKALVDAYIEETTNPDANSDATFEDTVVRADHRMKSMELDQSKDLEYHDKAEDFGTDDDSDV